MKDELTIELLLRELYNTERKLAERNYAHGHSFEEWKQQKFNLESRDSKSIRKEEHGVHHFI